MKELDLIDKCHFFREKNTTCHIVCMYLGEEWEDCFLIEVNDGKEILAVTGTIEGRSYLSKFIAPNSSYEEIEKNGVCGTELSKICQIINRLCQ